MEWLIMNWFLVVAAIAVLAGAAYSVWYFITTPKEQRWQKVSAWLHYAVVEAEKELGSGTGQLKLAKVYNMFISTFKFVPMIMSYKTFSDLVDKALVWMRVTLEANQKITEYVEGVVPLAEV